MYRISVITVCFNSAETIRDTIESLLQQTYQDFEYIIVDGNSIDGTLDIIKEYKCILGNRMKLISEKDHGVYDAMNKGIKMASGDIIGILNSDDWYENSTLQWIASAFEEDADIVTGELQVLTFDKKKIRVWKNSDIEKTVLYKMPVNHPATFVKRSTYEEIGFFDLSYKLSADYDFICRAYINGKRFKKIDRILTNMRLGGLTGGLKDGGPGGLKNAFISAKEDYLLIKRNFQRSLKLRYYIKVILLRLKQMKRLVIKNKEI